MQNAGHCQTKRFTSSHVSGESIGVYRPSAQLSHLLPPILVLQLHVPLALQPFDPYVLQLHSQQSYDESGKSLPQLSLPHIKAPWHSASKSQSPCPKLHFWSSVQHVISVLLALHLSAKSFLRYTTMVVIMN